MEKEKSLFEIFQVFIKRSRTLLLIIASFLLLGTSLGFLLNEREYVSTASVIVGTEAERNTDEYNSLTGEPIKEKYIKYGSNNISNEESNFYKEIIKSPDLLKEIINDLDLELTVKELRESVSIKIPENSNTILFTVAMPDFKDVDKVANKFIETFKNENYEITRLDNIKIMNTATEPEKSNSVDVILYVLLSLFFGTIVGLIVVLIQEYLDDRIQSEKEVKSIGLSVLGKIKKESFEEDLKEIRTNISYLPQFDNKNVFVVASPNIENENISTGLADVFSQTTKSVLLIDADFRITNSNENNEGLSDILANDLNSENLIRTSKNNYQVLTAGSNLDYPSEKLTSLKMEELLKKFKKSFSYVIIKGHPINNVTDTVALTGLTDGLILQIKIDQTELKDIIEIKENFEKLNIDILGVILVY